jgi:Fis family transcriptional regulator
MARGGARGVKKSIRIASGNELARSVERSLDEYFRKLDGEPPHCIYEMVIAHVERALLTSILDRSNGNQTHAAEMLGLLHRFAARGEGASLLALASLVAAHDDPKDSLALLAELLCDAVALDPSESLMPDQLAAIRTAIPRERLLAAADQALASIRWLTVNADVRLLAENVVAELV